MLAMVTRGYWDLWRYERVGYWNWGSSLTHCCLSNSSMLPQGSLPLRAFAYRRISDNTTDCRLGKGFPLMGVSVRWSNLWSDRGMWTGLVGRQFPGYDWWRNCFSSATPERSTLSNNWVDGRCRTMSLSNWWELHFSPVIYGVDGLFYSLKCNCDCIIK